ncbi:DUF1799 domain-containing protein [Desulfosarcina ovata]|uniref:Uncharacterized protein n=1 Tax=Desulfosarcina ovata subsp. ovata TaxID=2752305 RepID=A0A5K8AJS3_9BACT|nr:DUF1799 domain-containing protein [Desulfosarcina ovata]BBO92050.1 hypothetical protein DSCOOX_52300 [Desulfosarcina ovata subsp. ovata]
MPENYEAFDLWMAVQTQWRAGGFGIIGLDYNTLYHEADRLEIDLSPCMMSKIKALEASTLRKAHAERDDNRSAETQGQSKG